MGIPVDFEGTTIKFVAPKGREDAIGELRAFCNGRCMVTAWQFTEEEIAEINRTGKVFVSVMSGKNFFPILVGSSESVRAMLVDHGGTFPRQKDAKEIDDGAKAD